MRDHVGADGAIDYDAGVILDAEELAEGGIGEAYASLHPVLTQLGVTPAPIVEHDDGDSYRVEFDGQTYSIYEGELGEEEDPWAKATFVLFDIVNRQLSDVEHKIYAINGGNELNAISLTPTSVERARAVLPEKRDWPYLPTDEPDWYGFPH